MLSDASPRGRGEQKNNNNVAELYLQIGRQSEIITGKDPSVYLATRVVLGARPQRQKEPLILRVLGKSLARVPLLPHPRRPSIKVDVNKKI